MEITYPISEKGMGVDVVDGVSQGRMPYFIKSVTQIQGRLSPIPSPCYTVSMPTLSRKLIRLSTDAKLLVDLAERHLHPAHFASAAKALRLVAAELRKIGWSEQAHITSAKASLFQSFSKRNKPPR